MKSSQNKVSCIELMEIIFAYDSRYQITFFEISSYSFTLLFSFFEYRRLGNLGEFKKINHLLFTDGSFCFSCTRANGSR